MQLPVDFFDTFVPELIKENVKVHVMGFTEYLPAHTQDAVNRAIEQTKENTGMVLNFALNYGSRAEMLQAIQKLYEELDHTQETVEITEEMMDQHLMTGFLPAALRDPELVIRVVKNGSVIFFFGKLLIASSFSLKHYGLTLMPNC